MINKLLLLNVMLILFLLTDAQGQDQQKKNWGVAAGIGYPDHLHIEVSRGLVTSYGLGLQVGSGIRPLLSQGQDRIFAYAVSVNQKFGFGKALVAAENFSGWYISQRTSYVLYSSGVSSRHRLYGSLTVGKHWPMYEHLVFALDAGFTVMLMEQEKAHCTPMYCEGDGASLFPRLWPAGRMQFIYRF